MQKQLQLDLRPSKYAGFESCREFISGKSLGDFMQSSGRYQKAIAADMDLSPSHLSKKLSANGDNRFTLDDLEKYVQVTGDKEPIRYLVNKYLSSITKEEIDAQIQELMKQKEMAA